MELCNTRKQANGLFISLIAILSFAQSISLAKNSSYTDIGVNGTALSLVDESTSEIAGYTTSTIQTEGVHKIQTLTKVLHPSGSIRTTHAGTVHRSCLSHSCSKSDQHLRMNEKSIKSIVNDVTASNYSTFYSSGYSKEMSKSSVHSTLSTHNSKDESYFTSRVISSHFNFSVTTLNPATMNFLNTTLPTVISHSTISNITANIAYMFSEIKLDSGAFVEIMGMPYSECKHCTITFGSNPNPIHVKGKSDLKGIILIKDVMDISSFKDELEAIRKSGEYLNLTLLQGVNVLDLVSVPSYRKSYEFSFSLCPDLTKIRDIVLESYPTPGRVNSCPLLSFSQNIQMHLNNASCHLFSFKKYYTVLSSLIVKEISNRCACPLDENYLTGEWVYCGSIYYKVTLHGPSTDVVEKFWTSYKQFIKSTNSVVLVGHVLSLNSSCFEKCYRMPVNPSKNKVNIKIITGILMVVCIVLVVVAAIFIVRRCKRTTSRQHFRLLRLSSQDENDVALSDAFCDDSIGFRNFDYLDHVNDK